MSTTVLGASLHQENALSLLSHLAVGWPLAGKSKQINALLFYRLPGTNSALRTRQKYYRF